MPSFALLDNFYPVHHLMKVRQTIIPNATNHQLQQIHLQSKIHSQVCFLHKRSEHNALMDTSLNMAQNHKRFIMQ